MTTTPTTEAVEAARVFATSDGPFEKWVYELLQPYVNRRYPHADWSDAAARILAAEVERLRAQCQRQGIDLTAFTGEVAELRADLEECRRALKGFVK